MISTCNKNSGFSLLEVLVALAVLAVGLTAALSLSARNIDNAYDLETRTVAHWVAQNEMVKFYLEPQLEEGDITGESEMAGRHWYWKTHVESTFDKTVLRVRTSVSMDKKREFIITQLIGYIPAKQQ